MRLFFTVLFLALAPLAATAQQLTGMEVYSVLTEKTRSYSGGSVSTFRPDGTFVFTHSNGTREEGTYQITQRGVVRVTDRANNRDYTFVVSQGNGQFLFNYGDRPGQGTIYTFE